MADLARVAGPPAATCARVTFRQLSRTDFASVAHIQVAPEQEIFSGTVAEAFAEDPARFDLHGICEDSAMVGMFKIDRAYHLAMPWAGRHTIGLRAFMVDWGHQRRGLASAAIRGLGPYLSCHYPGARIVKLTVDACNLGAIRCYERGGFIDNGRRIEGGPVGLQRIMWLDLRMA